MKSKFLPLLAPGLCLAAYPLNAEELKFTHPSGATATFYGQILPTYQSVDDGVATYDHLVDNSNSPSRLGLWIDMPMGENKFRFNLEVGLGLRNTSDTSQSEHGDWIDWQRTDIRKLEGVYSGRYGAFWFGQGSMATDGAAEVDNSGTSIVGYASLPDTAGGFAFRDGEALSDVTIGDVFKDFDGSRRFRLRYDTPDFSGFKLSVAYGEEILAEDDDADYYDTAIRYALENDQFKVDAALGYSWKNDEDTTEQLVASGSVVHVPTGLNLTLATGDERGDGGDYAYAKFGWAGDVWRYGTTAISIDYFGGEDYDTDGSESKSWGLQAVQTFAEQNIDAYIGYREFSYNDDSTADYRDINAFLLGTRWKF